MGTKEASERAAGRKGKELEPISATAFRSAPPRETGFRPRLVRAGDPKERLGTLDFDPAFQGDALKGTLGGKPQPSRVPRPPAQGLSLCRSPPKGPPLAGEPPRSPAPPSLSRAAAARDRAHGRQVHLPAQLSARNKSRAFFARTNPAGRPPRIELLPPGLPLTHKVSSKSLAASSQLTRWRFKNWSQRSCCAPRASAPSCSCGGGCCSSSGPGDSAPRAFWRDAPLPLGGRSRGLPAGSGAFLPPDWGPFRAAAAVAVLLAFPMVATPPLPCALARDRRRALLSRAATPKGRCRGAKRGGSGPAGKSAFGWLTSSPD